MIKKFAILMFFLFSNVSYANHICIENNGSLLFLFDKNETTLKSLTTLTFNQKNLDDMTDFMEILELFTSSSSDVLSYFSTTEIINSFTINKMNQDDHEYYDYLNYDIQNRKTLPGLNDN